MRSALSTWNSASNTAAVANHDLSWNWPVKNSGKVLPVPACVRSYTPSPAATAAPTRNATTVRTGKAGPRSSRAATSDAYGRDERLDRTTNLARRMDIVFNSSPAVEPGGRGRARGRRPRHPPARRARRRRSWPSWARPTAPTATRRRSTSCSSAPSRSSPASARRWPRPAPTSRAPWPRSTRRRPSRGLALMCSGTHPFSHYRDQTISPNPRYARLVDEMAWMARRLQIFGIHYHVGVRSPEKAVAIANALAVLHPALPRPVRVEPVLERARHRAGVEPQQGVRGAAHRRPPGTRSRTGTTSSSSWRRSCRPRPSARSARCGGTSARTRRSAPSSCACATASRPWREVAALAALAQSLVEWLDTLHRPGLQAAGAPRLGRAPEQVAGRAPRPRRVD